jgi:hypothetical protein
MTRTSTIPPRLHAVEEDMLANRKGEKIGPQILAAPAHAGSFRQLAGLAAQPLNDAAARCGVVLGDVGVDLPQISPGVRCDGEPRDTLWLRLLLA